MLVHPEHHYFCIMDKRLAPIVVFCYNRPIHIKLTVQALQNSLLAKDSDLFIFSDGYKDENDKTDVEKVRNYIHSIKGFKKISIIEREFNYGLANSVIKGVNSIINKYGNVIVLEDDLLISPFFLIYMNNCLKQYEDSNIIFSISGYTPKLKNTNIINNDVFLNYRTNSWGWATWENRWKSVDWEVKDFNSFIRSNKKIKDFNKGGTDLTPMLLKQNLGLIDSWAIRFSYACFKQGKYCVYPKYTLIKNIGADGSGTHLNNTHKFDNEMYMNNLKASKDVKEYDRINNEMYLFFKQKFYRRGYNFFWRIIYILRGEK